MDVSIVGRTVWGYLTTTAKNFFETISEFFRIVIVDEWVYTRVEIGHWVEENRYASVEFISWR
jgi:hypothetical protein